MTSALFVAAWELPSDARVAVVVDVLRAFTTAAYAFAGGASEIFLTETVDEALGLAASMPEALVMGEDRGRIPPGFHLSNSPVEVTRADLAGRSLIQRTSAGTRAVVAAMDVPQVFAASLVCASATADALRVLSPAVPTYVISGRFQDATEAGLDDLLTAELIERARCGQPLESETTAAAVAASAEAVRTLALGAPHVHPEDIAYATRVDAFPFAMQVERTPDKLRRLVPVSVPQPKTSSSVSTVTTAPRQAT